MTANGSKTTEPLTSPSERAGTPCKGLHTRNGMEWEMEKLLLRSPRTSLNGLGGCTALTVLFRALVSGLRGERVVGFPVILEGIPV